MTQNKPSPSGGISFFIVSSLFTFTLLANAPNYLSDTAELTYADQKVFHFPILDIVLLVPNTLKMKPPLVGREGEIKQLFDDLKGQRSIRLIEGEAGIGKSALLEEFYNKLKKEDPSTFFVGFYDKDKALTGHSLIYPFITVLEDLLEWAKETEKSDERIKGTTERLESAFIKFAKEKGTEMVVAIIQSVVKKAGFEEPFNVIKDFIKTHKGEKSGLGLAQDYVFQHKDEAILSYVGIFRSLVQQFRERRFVLIFDQFESAGKQSVDFLINFGKLMPDNFHIIVSFKAEDTWIDAVARKSYEYAKRNLIDIGAKESKLEGLSEEAIGEWIKSVTGENLPSIPHLRRIKENSAGLPMLLQEWIRQSQKLEYDEIRRGELCKYILGRRNGLSEDAEELVKLDKMSVLVQPPIDENKNIDLNELAKFLDTKDDYLSIFIDKLIDNELIAENTLWFRHELIQRCLEDRLHKYVQTYNNYHAKAALLYQNLYDRAKNTTKDISYLLKTEYAYAYHLHEAGKHEESYTYNIKVAHYASRIGDLDIAERCYIRAINDATQLDDNKKKLDSLYSLTADIYSEWGRNEEAYNNYLILLEYYRNTDDKRKIVSVLLGMAGIHFWKAEYETALKLYNESLAISKELGEQYDVAAVLINIANIHSQKGEYETALKLYNESLAISKQTLITLSGEQLKNWSADALRVAKFTNISAAMANMALIYERNKRDYETALNLYNESLTISEQLGELSTKANTLTNMAIIYSEIRQYDTALNLLSESISVFKQLGNQEGVAVALTNMAAVHKKRGEIDTALSLLNESLDISRQLRDQKSIALALTNKANIYTQKGEYNTALNLYNESLALSEQLKDQEGTADALIGIGYQLLYRRGEYREALPYVLQAHKILEKLHSPNMSLMQQYLKAIQDALGPEDYQMALHNIEKDSQPI
jgi:tetratricopeptide (TPR) repeat protein